LNQRLLLLLLLLLLLARMLLHEVAGVQILLARMGRHRTK
jgi:hypothetical protein